MLDSASKAYAAGIAARVLDALPDSKLGFLELSEEAELRVRLMAESLSAGRPELLAHEFSWLKVLYARRGQDWRRLMSELDCMEAELVDRLPESVSPLVATHTSAARARLGEAESGGGFLEGEGPHRELARTYFDAIIAGRPQAGSDAVISAAEEGVAIDELHDYVIVLAQQEIGRLWHEGELVVADEHLATRTTEQLLTLLRTYLPRPKESARRVLAAGAPGSYHDIGLQMAADRLRQAGWTPVVLGADTPIDEFPRAAMHYDVDLVAMSLPMTLNIRQSHAAIGALRADTSIPVIVGGAPLAVVPDLWAVMGADGGTASASEVVAVAERVVSSSPRGA